MRILMPRRISREPFETGASSTIEELEPVRARSVQDEQLVATQAIGSRQEVLSSTLEGISQLAAHLRALEPMVDDLREPLAEELTAHRREHAELITTRALLEQTTERLQRAQELETSLAARLSETEHLLGESNGGQARAELAAESSMLEVGRLRDALEQSETNGSGLAAALRDGTLRIKQLEEDGATLRAQAQEDEERRREVDALLARASQESLLVEEEAQTLRRRLDQTGTELARVTRSEAEVTAQMNAERTRAIANQAAAERAQTEVLNLGRVLEERTEAARSEAAALNARLETAAARSAKLESLNADLARRLSDSAVGQRQTERRSGDLQIALERAGERAEQLEEELATHRAAQAALERARMAALERGDQLGRTLQAQEVTIRRAEERLRELQSRVDALTADQDLLRRAHEQQGVEASGELERLGAELAMSEASLQAARRDRSRPVSATVTPAQWGGTLQANG